MTNEALMDWFGEERPTEAQLGEMEAKAELQADLQMEDLLDQVNG